MDSVFEDFSSDRYFWGVTELFSDGYFFDKGIGEFHDWFSDFGFIDELDIFGMF